MMKLKYLFDNRDLAMMLLACWPYDADRLDLLNRFRISSNAVYPFAIAGETHFLRFAPVSEKEPMAVAAELSYLNALRAQGYPAAEAVPAKDGQTVVVSETPWGRYVATAFRGVPGMPLDQMEMTPDLAAGYGRALGTLHRCACSIPAAPGRPDWAEVLRWCDKILHALGAPAAALTETERIYSALFALPRPTGAYGLNHYDFEPDNVFFDPQTGRYHVIDFDDAMVHWYAMDVAQALSELNGPRDAFLSGYRDAWPLHDALLEHLPLFRRFADLYGYTRCLRSLSERWEREPDWMAGLRGHITAKMAQTERKWCFLAE